MKILARRTLIVHLRPSLRFLHASSPFTTSADDSHRRRFDISSSPSFTTRRNYDEENRNVKVTVWWDFENCQVPNGVNVERVASRVASAIRSAGIKGPITITAFGDVMQLSRVSQEGLTSTGVCLNHVPHGGKNSSDRSFMADIIYWVTQNPPPAHFFLITSDKDFANILHRLRMSNYNVLLASNSNQLSGVLCSAATIMWPWAELIKGDDITPKHYNHPPDGFYGSWYGQYKGLLDDPFQSSIQCFISQPEESTQDKPEVKIRPIPRAILNGIRNILHSHPKGLSIRELHDKLQRKNIVLDKDYYGYKKFSKFIASLSGIVRFVPNTSMVFDKRQTDSEDPCSKSSKTETFELKLESDEEPQTCIAVENDTLQLPTPVIKSEDIVSRGVPTQIPIVIETMNLSSKPSETETDEPENVVAENGLINDEKEGLFKRIWMALTRTGSDKSDIVSKENTISSENATKTNTITNIDTEEKAVKLEESYSDASKSVADIKNIGQSDDQNEASSNKMGLLSKLSKWWQLIMFGESSQAGIFVGKHSQINDTEEHVNKAHELFSSSDFWGVIESFLLTPKGADLIFMSMTREQLIQNLQKKGPPVLKDLNHPHMLNLIDLLISEKKLIEESASQTFPFKIPTRKGTTTSDSPHKSTGLSSLFAKKETLPPQNFTELKTWYHNVFPDTKDTIKPEKLQKVYDTHFNKKLIPSSYGYPTARSLIFACSVDNEDVKRNKGEVLNDCHKLVMELLKDNPNGFNMGSLRPAFVRKYGYALDCHAVGYPSVASLLQIMPGVRIESSYVFDENVGGSEDFDELGPMRSSTSEKKKGVDYSRASLSDEEFSDSGDEVLEGKVKKGEEDSSLMQILDSWYSDKESRGGEKGKIGGGRSNVRSGVDCSKLSSRVSNKRYSFVADGPECDKDKLLDNILGGLKRAGGDSKLQS